MSLPFTQLHRTADDLAAQQREVDPTQVTELRSTWDQVRDRYLPEYQQLIEDRLTLAESYLRLSQ